MIVGNDTAVVLRRLLRDLAADQQAINRQAAEAAALSSAAGQPGAERAAALAVCLHHYYTAVESAAERILRVIDGALPEGADFHVAILREAFKALPGVRPAIFERASFAQLDELRRFRHFFRHAYAVNLEWDELTALAARLRSIHPEVEADLRRIDGFLQAALRQSETTP